MAGASGGGNGGDGERRFAGTARRVARVGASMGGLVARAAGERYLGLPLDRERHARDLAAALGGLKGPLMKVAQILSSIPDALPEAYARELAALQADAPHMGWPFVKRRMQAELGLGWEGRFTTFERTAAAAASLGQVHRATAPDGQALACKLQYPDMDTVVEADLRQLQVIIGLYRKMDGAIDPSAIQEEIAARLREELDYRREAAAMRLYAHMLADELAVSVPAPVDALTTRRLLTMSWLEGERIQAFADRASLEARNRIAVALFRAWYVPFYDYGVIHGDPHLGNYTVRPDGSGINLLDFGVVRVFPPAFVGGVIDLYHALRDGDREQAVAAYRAWGFTDLSDALIDALNLWASFVYAPLMEDRPRLISEEERMAATARSVVARVQAEIRRLGGVRPPREFVLVERAAVGLGGLFLRLRAEVNWHALYRDLIDDFDAGRLATRQSAALAASGLKPGA